MKILVGMPSEDSWGGPASSEPPFVAALSLLGTDVTQEIYVYGDKETPTPFFQRVRRVFETARRFRKALVRERFDLVYLNTAFDLKTIVRDSFSLFWMKPRGAKVFFKLHGSEAERFQNTNFLVRALIRYLQRKVDAFGIHTSEEKANFVRLGFAESKFYFVKNAVTIHAGLPETYARREKEKTEKFRILFVSRFIAAKGLIETIRACAKLRERGYDFELCAVGDGKLRTEAEQTAEDLGLSSHVKFTGYLPETEVAENFLSSDLFVFPTRHAEGFPNVLFKAVAIGLPVVTTRIRAAADYLSDPENCLFCTQEPDDIAAKIILLIENKGLRESMSANNTEYGKTLLPEEIAREFLEIYAKVIAR